MEHNYFNLEKIKKFVGFGFRKTKHRICFDNHLDMDRCTKLEEMCSNWILKPKLFIPVSL